MSKIRDLMLKSKVSKDSRAGKQVLDSDDKSKNDKKGSYVAGKILKKLRKNTEE